MRSRKEIIMDPDTSEFLEGYNNWYNNLSPAGINEETQQAIKKKQIKELIEVLVKIKKLILDKSRIVCIIKHGDRH